MTDPMHTYETALAVPRLAVTRDLSLAMLTSPGCQTQLFARWLLRFSAHSVTLTRELEHRDCVKSAVAEGIHAIDRWLVDHLHSHADIASLLDAQLLASARRYVFLHEDTAAGSEPRCRAAIQYEFAQLWLGIGPDLLHNCDRTFGADARYHAAITEQVDLAGKRFPIKRRYVTDSLNEARTLLPAMIDTGQQALALYSAFLAECLRLADADLDVPTRWS